MKAIVTITFAIKGVPCRAHQTTGHLAKGQGPQIFCLLMLTVPWHINAQEPSQSATSADVYEAVVRYQMKSFDFKSFCVQIDDKDADEEFSRRFNPRQVKGASGCRGKSKGKFSWSVVDKKTGKPSVILHVGRIHWLTNDEADVDGGYTLAVLGGAGGSYHVIREGTHWVVTEFKVENQV